MSIDWNRLYREHYEGLVRFLHRKVWDEDRAQDLAQEVFVKALDHEPENPRAWLYRVAGNMARDEARTQIRRKRHLVLIKSEATAKQESQADASDDLVRAEAAAQLREALNALSERDREVLLLKEAGLDYREISQQTGLAVGAIGTTLARARRKLAESYRALEGTNGTR